MIWSSMVPAKGPASQERGKPGRSQLRADRLMKAVPETLPPDTSIAEAEQRMRRCRVDALPVTVGGRAVGMVSRWDLVQAIEHRLGRETLEMIMTVPLPSVAPDASWGKVYRLMTENRIGHLAVVRAGRLLGMVAQSDLLRREPGDDVSAAAAGTGSEEQVDLRPAMERRYSPAILRILRRAGRLGGRRGEEVFLVGGSVRDLLLDIDDQDMDLAVVGDGMAFARAYVSRHGGKVVCYKRFATALMVLPGGLKLDVVSARWEQYRHPGALPAVEPGALVHDLYRRDFTINGLAIDLSGDRFGRLVDPFGGRRDLRRGIIEVMHNLSFVDDPTRMIRAVRFEGRYGFRMSARTRHLLRQAAGARMLERISGQRLREELLALLREPDPLPAVRRLDRMGILESLHPGLALTPDRIRLLKRTGRYLSRWRERWPDEEVSAWMAYLLGLFSSLPAGDAGRLSDRLTLQRRAVEALGLFHRFGAEVVKTLSAPRRPPDSVLYRLLHRFPAEVLIALMAASGRRSVSGRIFRYRNRLRDVGLEISGEDLKKMGLSPGTAYGRVLDSVLMARLDGRVGGRREQLALARRLARRGTSPDEAPPDNGPGSGR
jgi:tRNA nucleotidyltransferase (CCA-adding enzyme)